MCAALSGTERIVRRERVFTVDGRPSAAAAGWLFHVSCKNLPVVAWNEVDSFNPASARRCQRSRCFGHLWCKCNIWTTKGLDLCPSKCFYFVLLKPELINVGAEHQKRTFWQTFEFSRILHFLWLFYLSRFDFLAAEQIQFSVYCQYHSW